MLCGLITLLLGLPAPAQLTELIVYADGQQVQMQPFESVKSFTEGFLNGHKDGTLRTLRQGQVVSELTKAGDQVTFVQGDHSETMTVKEAISSLDRAQARADLQVCQILLNGIAMELNISAKDHGGELPTRLSELIPNYLRRLPKCPTDCSEGYSLSYQAGEGHFTLHCAGDHTALGVPAGLPAYDSCYGLVLSTQDREEVKNLHQQSPRALKANSPVRSTARRPTQAASPICVSASSSLAP